MSSRLVRAEASGVRSSCEASATSWRWALTDLASASSIVLKATANRPSSSERSSSVRSLGSPVAAIRSASSVRRLTGRSVARETSSPTAAAPATRWRDRHEVTIFGHEHCATRLDDRSAFRPLRGGETLDGGVRALAIELPRRAEIPFELPSHRALAFGDTVLEIDGELRVWPRHRNGERRRTWYA